MKPDKVVPIRPAAPSAPTVLVVDDEPGVRQLLVAWTTSFGYSVQAAADSDAALEEMLKGKVDVAICDIRMPGKDGVWLIDQLRLDYPETAIVIATGVQDLRPELTLSPGIAGYLVKPFQREQLAIVLQHALTPDSPWISGRASRMVRNGSAS